MRQHLAGQANATLDFLLEAYQVVLDTELSLEKTKVGRLKTYQGARGHRV